MRPNRINLNNTLFNADSLPAFVLRGAWTAIYEAMRQQNEKVLAEILRGDSPLYPVDAESQRALVRAFLDATDRDLVLE